jgi:hypothetical protein
MTFTLCYASNLQLLQLMTSLSFGVVSTPVKRIGIAFAIWRSKFYIQSMNCKNFSSDQPPICSTSSVILLLHVLALPLPASPQSNWTTAHPCGPQSWSYCEAMSPKPEQPSGQSRSLLPGHGWQQPRLGPGLQAVLTETI